MESRKIVFKETAIIACGTAICTGVMIAVYALIGKFDLTVLVGGIVGFVLAVLNFLFMAMNVSVAADKAVEQDVKGGRSLMKLSYTTRLVVMFIILIVCAKSGITNPLASVLPLAFVRPVITIAEFFRK